MTHSTKHLNSFTSLEDKWKKEIELRKKLQTTKLKNLVFGKTFVITHDHGVCNDCENATKEQLSDLEATDLINEFRLLDDDRNLYYTGFSNDTSNFDPLDDFGMPNAGCTIIQYVNSKGEFEDL